MVQRHVLVWEDQFYVLKGGEHEKDKGRHHPLQETRVSGTHIEASCPGISSCVIEKCLAWHQSGSSESMALLPGFGFLREPPGKLSRSGMTHLQDYLFHPHTEEWFIQRLGSSDPWRKVTELQGVGVSHSASLVSKPCGQRNWS